MNATIERVAASGAEQKLAGGPLDQELEFLWEDCGRSGEPYDLSLGRISRNPVVRSRRTGKYLMLPWSRIIELAEEEGIDGK